MGTLVLVKATGEQTGGAFGLIDNILPAGFASPYHMHRNEDESFYVAEGEMTFYVGEETVQAGPGAWVYGPRGIPHGFEVEGTAPTSRKNDERLLKTPGFWGRPYSCPPLH